MSCNLCKYYKRGCYYCYLKDMDVNPNGGCESYAKRYYPAPEEPWCASDEDEDEDDAWKKVRELKEEIENLKKQESDEKED